MKTIKIKINIVIETNETEPYLKPVTTGFLKSISSGCYEEEYEAEFLEMDKFAQALIYSIPKHELPSFDVIEICKDGKSIGHGEA